MADVTNLNKFPVPSQNFEVAQRNAKDLDKLLNNPAGFVTNRAGINMLSLQELFTRVGYEVPVVYAASILMERATQTVDFGGTIFAPNPSDIPFTTSGTFETAKFVTVQGLTESDSGFVFYKRFITLAVAAADTNLQDGMTVIIDERTTGSAVESVWDIVLEATVTVNDIDVVVSTANASIALVQRPWDVKPSSSFIFDDAHLSHYNDVLPLFETRGHKLAFAISPKFTDEIRQLGDRLNTGEMLDAQKRGVEIINHSMTHANLTTTTSAERVMAEVETARQWLEDRGLNNVGFLAASSAVNQDVLAPIYAHHSYAMTVASANDIDIATTKLNNPRYSLSRWTMDGVASASTIESIKEAIRRGESIIVYDHDVPDPSDAFTRLTEVLDFIDTIPSLIDVQYPKDLVARFCGLEMKQDQHRDEKQIFNDTGGWSIAAGLGAAITSQEIQLTPTVTGEQTATRDFLVETDRTYTFSCNVRSGSWTGIVSMGVHYLDSGDSIISGYSIEGGSIDYDGENLQRHSVESHSPVNAVKARIFFRVNPIVADATTLLLRDPAMYTGRRIFFIDEKFTPTEVFTSPFDLDLSHDTTDFFIRLDVASNTINAPTNQKDLDIITLHMRSNGSNRTIVFDSVFNPNPNTIFNTNAVGNVMIVQFKFYRSEWWQLADVAWV